MKLFIVRHAIAVSRGTPWAEDDARELTEEGRTKMHEIALGLKTLRYLPELILSSPLPRATQTAEIILEVCEDQVKIKITPSLAPGGDRSDLYREIERYEKKLKSLMIVGHQPSLGEIAGEIAFGSPEHYIELKKGGVCVVEWENARGAPKGTMVSLLPPAVMRKISH